MVAQFSHTIRIAAALIDDGAGRVLLVRKHGSRWFMQPGGKIEPGEPPLAALRRELAEELGLDPGDGDARYLGRFSAPAANEADHIVEAEVFHLRIGHTPAPHAEIAEAVWVTLSQVNSMPLALLSRDCILPLLHRL